MVRSLLLVAGLSLIAPSAALAGPGDATLPQSARACVSVPLPVKHSRPLPANASRADRLGAVEILDGSMVLCVNHGRRAPMAVRILAVHACHLEWKTVGYAGYAGATYTTLKECRAQRRQLAGPLLTRAQANGSKACFGRPVAPEPLWAATYGGLGFGVYLLDERC